MRLRLLLSMRQVQMSCPLTLRLLLSKRQVQMSCPLALRLLPKKLATQTVMQMRQLRLRENSSQLRKLQQREKRRLLLAMKEEKARSKPLQSRKFTCLKTSQPAPPPL